MDKLVSAAGSQPFGRLRARRAVCAECTGGDRDGGGQGSDHPKHLKFLYRAPMPSSISARRGQLRLQRETMAG